MKDAELSDLELMFAVFCVAGIECKITWDYENVSSGWRSELVHTGIQHLSTKGGFTFMFFHGAFKATISWSMRAGEIIGARQ